MPIILKSRSEIESMRRAGALGRSILEKMSAAVAPGVTTGELNEIARVELDRVGAGRAGRPERLDRVLPLRGRRAAVGDDAQFAAPVLALFPFFACPRKQGRSRVASPAPAAGTFM